MEDLNQKAGCPDEASEEAKEVRTKNSDLLKKKLQYFLVSFSIKFFHEFSMGVCRMNKNC